MKGYRKEKTTMGRTMYIRMDEAEIRERSIYRATVTLTPVIMILAFATAAGMIRWW